MTPFDWFDYWCDNQKCQQLTEKTLRGRRKK